MIESYARLPRLLFVAVRTVRTKLTRMRIVCLMASAAIGRGIAGVRLGVARGACDPGVRPNEGKCGFPVVKVVFQPCGRVVARSTVCTVSTLMMIVRQVTGLTGSLGIVAKIGR